MTVDDSWGERFDPNYHLVSLTVMLPAKWCEITHDNRPISYSRYWTGTSLQSRLMRCNLFTCKLFNDIPPHEPPLQASSSSIPRTRNRPINNSWSNAKQVAQWLLVWLLTTILRRINIFWLFIFFVLESRQRLLTFPDYFGKATAEHATLGCNGWPKNFYHLSCAWSNDHNYHQLS